MGPHWGPHLATEGGTWAGMEEDLTHSPEGISTVGPHWATEGGTWAGMGEDFTHYPEGISVVGLHWATEGPVTWLRGCH